MYRWTVRWIASLLRFFISQMPYPPPAYVQMLWKIDHATATFCSGGSLWGYLMSLYHMDQCLNFCECCAIHALTSLLWLEWGNCLLFKKIVVSLKCWPTSWVESPSCFWRCGRNSGHRFYLIVCLNLGMLLCTYLYPASWADEVSG